MSVNNGLSVHWKLWEILNSVRERAFQSIEWERPKVINTTGHLFLTKTKLMDFNNTQTILESSSFTAKTLLCELWGKGKLACQAEEYLLAVFSPFSPAIPLLPWLMKTWTHQCCLYIIHLLFSLVSSAAHIFSFLYSVIPYPITETINTQNYTKKLHKKRETIFCFEG